MCRWIAYSGSPIPLENILTRPVNSLIDQSLDAQLLDMPVKTPVAISPKRRIATSGEGYGFSWVGRTGQIGLFRDPSPAWDSENIVSLAQEIVSPCFLGHVRAAPGRSVSMQNCHPFVHDGWMFQHNGFIGNFNRVHHRLTAQIDPQYLPYLEGNTDSEVCFYLALSFGLTNDPVGALRQLRESVRQALDEVESEYPFNATIGVSDGRCIIAMRTSVQSAFTPRGMFSSPSLFYTSGPLALQGHGGRSVEIPDGSTLVVSEPLILESSENEWLPFPDHTIGIFEPGKDPVLLSALPENESSLTSADGTPGLKGRLNP